MSGTDSRSRSRSRSESDRSGSRSRSHSGSSSGGSRSGSGGEEDDADLSDFEGHSGYKKGGYHPVQIGDVYGPDGRYTIEQKLGWGHFSTVWLASDATKPNDHPEKLVALKVQKSAIQYTEAANDEIKLLTEIEERYRRWKEENDAHEPELDSSVSSSAFAVETAHSSNTYIVHLLDHFTLSGPHGVHVCLVFERAGRNLLHVIKKYNYAGVPIRLVKSMVKQILAGFRFLHDECGIIHTDLKPENVLVSGPKLDPVVVAREREEIVAQRKGKEEQRKTEQKRKEIEELRQSMQKINLAAAPAKLTKNQKKRMKKKKKLQAAKQAAAGGGDSAAVNESKDDDDDEEDEKEEGESTDAAAAGEKSAEATPTSDEAKTSELSAAASTTAAAESAATPVVSSISEVDHLSNLIDSFLSGQTPEFQTKVADLGNGSVSTSCRGGWVAW
jgi:serine/threonine protein kinase